MHIEAYYLRQWSVPAPDARGHPAATSSATLTPAVVRRVGGC